MLRFLQFKYYSSSSNIIVIRFITCDCSALIMFRKKPTVRSKMKESWLKYANILKIKSLSSLRSSDRRKIADQIISDFNIELPKHDSQEVDQNDQDANSLTLGDIRNSLLPEGSQSARFTTTAGPNLSQVSGTVYVGAHPGHEQRILWIKFEERLFPTGRIS